MKPLVREVRNYWDSKRYKYVLDPEILELCVDVLEPHEIRILERGQEVCESSEALADSYAYIQQKVFNRHNDIASGYSHVDESGELIVTAKSAITELQISLSTLKNCNASCVYRIEDIQKEILPSLTFESIAEVTAAIILHNEAQKDYVSST